MATVTATKLQNFIGGDLVDTGEGQTEEVINPATRETIAEAPLSTEEDVNVARAHVLQPEDLLRRHVPYADALAKARWVVRGERAVTERATEQTRSGSS